MKKRDDVRKFVDVETMMNNTFTKAIDHFEEVAARSRRARHST